MARKRWLARLLPGIAPGAFLDRHWAQRPLAVHGPLERFGRAPTSADLADVYALLRGLPEGARALAKFAGGPLPLHPRKAAALYRTGAVTLMLDVSHLPEVSRLSRGLAAELETPGRSWCNAYASPVGVGTAMHFDGHEVFLVQLRGCKRWRYALNEQLPFPPAGHMVGDPLDPALAPLAASFPATMPEHAEEAVLRPGSVLFLPRGTWHASRAEGEDSLALTLAYKSTTWGELLCERLSARLRELPQWREPARGLLGPALARKRAARRLDSLVEAMLRP